MIRLSKKAIRDRDENLHLLSSRDYCEDIFPAAPREFREARRKKKSRLTQRTTLSSPWLGGGEPSVCAAVTLFAAIPR